MNGTRTHFREELHTLRHRLLQMGSEADAQVARAMEALTEQNSALADDVVASDDVIDSLDIEIEMECMRLLALQQPLARDLRLVGTALKVITDMERIADHAVDIAKVARKLAGVTFYRPLVDLPHMSDVVRQMLQDALASFINHDLDLVSKVVTMDDVADSLFHNIRTELHTVMQSHSELVVQASYLLFVAHYLERIADHAVNIAERVHYVETGELAQLAKSHQTAS